MVPQMQNCEDIESQNLVTLGDMTLALGGLVPLGLSWMIGQQVFSSSLALPNPSSMVCQMAKSKLFKFAWPDPGTFCGRECDI